MKHIRTIASIVCPITAVLLLVGEIIYSNELICDTKELSYVEEMITKIDDENRTLSQQIAERSSLAVIGKKAVEMGFVTSQKVLTLNPETAPVAFQFQ